MKPQEAKQLADLAFEVAKSASQVALEGFRSGAKIDRKQDTELVTAYDLKTEAFVRKQMAALCPEIPVVAEEEGGEATGDRVWYVDPIDGTTNFAHGHPFWAVSIGLVVRGVPIVGAIVAPALNLDWVG